MIITRTCSYDCPYHKGKIDWHHPVSSRNDVGIDLCEAHHSLIMGRKIRYADEIIINKTLTEMANEIYQLSLEAVEKVGLSEEDIDKH